MLELEENVIYRVTIPGRPYVKKNNQRAIGAGRFKKIIYTPEYIRWQNTAIAYIRQAPRPAIPIGFKINLKVLFFFENRMAEPDLSALYEGIQDVLEREGIIENDKLICGHNGSTKIFGENPRTEVEVTAYASSETGTRLRESIL